MLNSEIDNAVKHFNGVLPSCLYRDVCSSKQVDQLDGEFVDIWTKDGAYWRVKVYPSQPHQYI